MNLENNVWEGILPKFLKHLNTGNVIFFKPFPCQAPKLVLSEAGQLQSC